MQNPQDAGIFLFLKHLEGTCKARPEGPAERQPPQHRGTAGLRPLRSRLARAALAHAQSRRVPAPARMRQLVAVAEGAAAEEVSAVHSTPVAALQPETASSGRSADFSAAAR